MFDLHRGARQLEDDRLFAAARRRADDHGFAIFRSSSHVFPAILPSTADHAACPSGPDVWWHDAPCDLFVRARGLAWGCGLGVAHGAAEPVDCSASFEQLRERLVSDPRAGALADLPLAFFGRSFSARSSWPGWPAHWLLAPARLDYRRGAGHGTLFQLPIHAGDDAKSALGRLVADPRCDSRQAAVRSVPFGARAEDAEDLGSPELDAKGWIALVERAREAIRRGELAKVVLARAATLAAPRLSDEALGELLKGLTQRFDDCTVFSLRGIGAEPDEAFIAATPESLGRLAGDRFETMALAGTLPADAATEALLDDEKLREEQQIVTDELVSALDPLCSDLSWPERPRVRRLANVSHLETPITGQVAAGVDLLSLVRALHPSAAVGGSPSVAAQRWLSQREGLERGAYAAPVGWLDAAGGGHAVVSLRCGLWRGEQLRAFVGAGITAESDPAAEWVETEQKLAALANVLPEENSEMCVAAESDTTAPRTEPTADTVKQSPEQRPWVPRIVSPGPVVRALEAEAVGQ